MHFQDVMNTIVRAFEALGVAILVAGTVIAFGRYLLQLSRGTGRLDAFSDLRGQLGRSILLGLEVLVAADIVRTIVEVPTLVSAVSLGIIVFVRIALSFAIDVEIDGVGPGLDRAHDDAATVLGAMRPENGEGIAVAAFGERRQRAIERRALSQRSHR